MKSIAPDKPWLMPEVIEWLNLRCFDRSGCVVLETGSGGSTVFFAQRVKLVISYEHDAKWAERVRSELAQRNLTTVDLRCVPDYPTVGLSCLTPIDLALIDGRGRVRSVQTALPLLKPGGWLVLDDSDRIRYRVAHRLMEAWSKAKIVFRNGLDETTAWRIA